MSLSTDGPCLVAIEGHAGPGLLDTARRIQKTVQSRFPGRQAIVLAALPSEGEALLVTPEEASQSATTAPPLQPGAAQSAIPGKTSVMGALLREGVARNAAVSALVSAVPREEGDSWLTTMLTPILDGSFDYACPAYLRHRTEAAITTGILYPLTRTIFGFDLRQPLGGEAAIALPLAKRLLGDPDWRRDRAHAGSDAWVIAKVLQSGARLCQTWLGAWPRPEGPAEELSQTLARALSLFFREMERHAEHWQRLGAKVRAVPAFGATGFAQGDFPRLPIPRLIEAFRLGLRELAPVWGLVLSPTTLLALQRLAASPNEHFRIGDGLWARAVYDFAVAHMARVMERHQLLLSLTPLYLGWLAGFAAATETIDEDGVSARIQEICAAFGREKQYLISRWRWPDNFNP